MSRPSETGPLQQGSAGVSATATEAVWHTSCEGLMLVCGLSITRLPGNRRYAALKPLIPYCKLSFCDIFYFMWLNFLSQKHAEDWVVNLQCADDTIIALIFLSLMKSAPPRTDGTLLTLISQLSLHEQLIKHNLLCIWLVWARSTESLLAYLRRAFWLTFCCSGLKTVTYFYHAADNTIKY